MGVRTLNRSLNIAGELRARFAAEGSPARAKQQKAYMKSELGFHGVTMPEIRTAARALNARFGQLSPTERHDTVEALFASDFHDLRSAAIGLLELQRKALSPADAGWLVDLIRRPGTGWAHVDWLATKVLGHLTAENRRVLESARRWVKDKNFWVRRTSLLVQCDTLRAGAGDFDLFAELAVQLLPEKEFFIRKAIGWVLREVVRKRPELTFAFVREHGSAMSGLSFREATRKLPASMRAKLSKPGRVS